MKYNLIYSYTTANYNVYICDSRDANKNGMKFYLPRFIESSRGAITNTAVIISDKPKRDDSGDIKHTPLIYKQEELF